MMLLEERLKKIREDILNLREKEEKIKEKIKAKKLEEKNILNQIEIEKQKLEAEKNKRIAQIVSETFGGIEDGELEIFEQIMKENSDRFLESRYQNQMDASEERTW